MHFSKILDCLITEWAGGPREDQHGWERAGGQTGRKASVREYCKAEAMRLCEGRNMVEREGTFRSIVLPYFNL